MTTYQNDRDPFIYVIGWSELNLWYLGARWRVDCSPLDLWTRYFTSSKRVAEIREWFGEPDYFEILCRGSVEDVQKLERTIIRHFSLHLDERWLNKNAGTVFDNRGVVRTPEMKANLSRQRKGIPRPIADAEYAARRQRAVFKAMGVNNPIAKRHRKHFWDGEYRNLRDMEQLTGVPQKLLASRIRAGMTLEEAVAHPYKRKRG